MIEAILATAATIMGVAMSCSGIPQIYRIIKRKNSADVSIPMIIILLIAVIVWLIYAIYINNLPLIITDAVGIVVWGLTLITTIKYKRK